MNKIYNYLTFLYANFSFFFEELFLKRKEHCNVEKSDILKKGFQEITFPKDFKINFNLHNSLKVNKYLDKIILTQNDLFELINYFFIKLELAKKITILTNYFYSIDYFIAYKTFPISNEDENKPWFANHWHLDKPFSKNALKVIVPLKDINNIGYGGIQIIEKEKTKNILNNKISLNDVNIIADYQMIVKKNALLLFNPNLCLHKAGNPQNNYIREQIMFQLNISNNWKINSNIQKKQNFREPKFPFFSYFFDKKLPLGYL
jgi:hypothetical protein